MEQLCMSEKNRLTSSAATSTSPTVWSALPTSVRVCGTWFTPSVATRQTTQPSRDQERGLTRATSGAVFFLSGEVLVINLIADSDKIWYILFVSNIGTFVL